MKKQLRSTLMLFSVFLYSLFCIAGVSFGADKFPEISTADLKGKFDAGEKFVLVNALSLIEFNEITIKGSVNIPSSKLVAGHPNLPDDKSVLMIFFCKGPKCSKSRKSAKKASGLGYTNILVYNEGMPAWAKARYPIVRKVKYPKFKPERMRPQAVAAARSTAVILDIRGKEVLKVGKLSGSIHISLDNLDSQYGQLPKGQKIIIIDHTGKQVNIAAKFLSIHGYADLAVLDGGMLGWKRAGVAID